MRLRSGEPLEHPLNSAIGGPRACKDLDNHAVSHFSFVVLGVCYCLPFAGVFVEHARLLPKNVLCGAFGESHEKMTDEAISELEPINRAYRPDWHDL
jgi:hypothetical protein